MEINTKQYIEDNDLGRNSHRREKYKEMNIDIDFSRLNWRHRLLWAVKIIFGIKTKVKKRVNLL